MNKKIIIKIILFYIIGFVFAQIGIKLNNNKNIYAFIVVLISGFFTVIADFYWINSVKKENTYLRVFLLLVIISGIIGFTGMSIICFLSNNLGILNIVKY